MVSLDVFRRKEFDGLIVEVMRDKKVRLRSRGGGEFASMTMTPKEMSEMASFVRWAVGKLDGEVGGKRP